MQDCDERRSVYRSTLFTKINESEDSLVRKSILRTYGKSRFFKFLDQVSKPGFSRNFKSNIGRGNNSSSVSYPVHTASIFLAVRFHLTLPQMSFGVFHRSSRMQSMRRLLGVFVHSVVPTHLSQVLYSPHNHHCGT